MRVTIKDAEAEIMVHEDGQKYMVFYAVSPTFRVSDALCEADVLDADKFRMIAIVQARDKETVFGEMQGENWSPTGEARDLIKRCGLQHTSMSVGDVLIDPVGVFWVCDVVGFKQLS